MSLDVVHRFADPEYAAITLAMRRGERTATTPAPHQALGHRPGWSVGVRDVFETLWNATRSGSTPPRPNAPRRWPNSPPPAPAGHGAGPDGAGGRVPAGGRHPGTDHRPERRDPRPAGRGRSRRRPDRGHHQPGERIGVGDRVTTRRNDRTSGSRTATPGPSPQSPTTATSTWPAEAERHGPSRPGTPPGTSSWPTPPPSTAPRARPPTPATWSWVSTPAPPRPTSR